MSYSRFLTLTCAPIKKYKARARYTHERKQETESEYFGPRKKVGPVLSALSLVVFRAINKNSSSSFILCSKEGFEHNLSLDDMFLLMKRAI